MVIKIPDIKTKNISLLGSLNLSDNAKIITIKIDGKIVIDNNNKFMFFLLFYFFYRVAKTPTSFKTRLITAKTM